MAAGSASVDAYLATMSWDQTWNAMSGQMARISKPRTDTVLRVGA